jgi:hypothetical protein
VRGFLEALRRRDELAAIQSLASDVEWYPYSAGVGVDVVHGPDAVREFGEAFFRVWEKAEFEIREIIDAEDAVVVWIRWRYGGEQAEWKRRSSTRLFTCSTAEDHSLSRERVPRRGPRGSGDAGVGPSPLALRIAIDLGPGRLATRLGPAPPSSTQASGCVPAGGHDPTRVEQVQRRPFDCARSAALLP